MAGEDRLRAVELLGEQGPHQQVRPSHRAQRQGQAGPFENRLGQAFGAADGEGDRADAPVPPVAEQPREVFAGQGLSAGVERDQDGVLGDLAEQAFAREIQRATGKEERGMHVGIDSLPDEEIPAQGGSTDVAEVSRIAPTAKIRVASSPLDTPWHAWPVVASGGTSIGHKAMLTAARTLAGAVVELAVSPDVVEAARADFLKRTGGEPYVSPIPVDQKPPVPGG